MNWGHEVVVKFDPVSVNFAVSKGCGMVIGEVLCATELVVFEELEFVGEPVTLGAETARAVVIVFVIRVLPPSLCAGVSVAASVIAGVPLKLSTVIAGVPLKFSSSWAWTWIIGETTSKATRNSIRGR